MIAALGCAGGRLSRKRRISAALQGGFAAAFRDYGVSWEKPQAGVNNTFRWRSREAGE